MLMTHGATWLMMRTDQHLLQRSRTATQILSTAYLVTFIAAGLWLWLGIEGYSVISVIDFNGAIDPLSKVVEQNNPGWMANYTQYPVMRIAPIVGIIGAVLALLAATINRSALAF